MRHRTEHPKPAKIGREHGVVSRATNMTRWAGLFATFLASSVAAHDWYEGTSDPLTKKSCCGGFDCREIPASDIEALPNGGFRFKRYGYYIPPARVQTSPDDHYHLCDSTALLSSPLRGPERSELPSYLKRWTCFFAPRLTN
jgi:hypothetical protein